MSAIFDLVQPEINGEGSFTPPPLSDDTLLEICRLADQLDSTMLSRQVREAVYLLVAHVQVTRRRPDGRDI